MVKDESSSDSPGSRAARDFLRPQAVGRAFRLGLSLGAVGVVTFLCSHLIRGNVTTVGFIYLIAVLVIAARWGFLESLVASVASVLCFNFFFFEPVGTFNIAEPENWVALFAFLVTSLVASQLSARAKRRTQEALDRRQEMERLYALSRAILLIDANASPGRQIADQIRDIFGLGTVALYDRKAGEVHHAGSGSPTGIEERLRQSAASGTAQSDAASSTVITPILLGGQTIGSLAVQGGMLSVAALQALANLVAIALEKVRGQEAANRAEAARQSEELKSTLLDSLAHEFKTPLTSIKAAATALLLTPLAGTAEQRELVSIVDEEVDHLASLVTEATQMARIEAGELRLNAGVHSAGELIGNALEQMKAATEGRKITVGVAEDLPAILVDPDLMELALRHLLDNAVKYSPPASPVAVRAEHCARGVRISVADEGPGIPERERSRVFEKFYRSPSTRQHVLGTGMGLAIAREIVSAHGGEVGIENRPGGGSQFWIILPKAAEEKIA
jgi:two-component system sensor histidine kinase KdpD